MRFSAEIRGARQIALVVIASLAAPVAAATPSTAFPLTTEACFTSDRLAEDQAAREAGIVSLTVRARNPLTDGDGDFPAALETPPEDPASVPVTLVVGFRDQQPGDFRWGARFSCTAESMNRNRLACSVADWCLDAGFDVVVHGDDAIDLVVFPDSGLIGHLGNPCGSERRGLAGSAQAKVAIYELVRSVGDACR